MGKKIWIIGLILILLALPVMSQEKPTTTTTTMPMTNEQKIDKTYDYAKKIYESTRYSISVFGTEYSLGDEYGKLFLQLLDTDNRFIDSTEADCFISVYYPNATLFINHSIMTYADEGLFFLDFAVPESYGVYMVSALCFMPNITNSTVWDNMETGNGSGGDGWSSDWKFSSITRCYFDNDPFRNPRDTWQLTCDNVANATRDFNSSSVGDVFVTFWGKSYSLENGEYCYWDYFNGTNWINLLTHGNGDESANMNFYSYKVSQYGLSGNSSFRMRSQTSSSDDYCHVDDIEIKIANIEYGESYGYQTIRGSGEIHISKGWSCENEILCLLENARIINDRIVNFHNHEYCIDNETLQHNITYEYCIGGNCKDLSDIMNEHCNDGCDYVTNSCSPNPTLNSVLYLVIFLVFVLVIYAFSRLIR